MGGMVCPLGCRDSRNNPAEKINSYTDLSKEDQMGAKEKYWTHYPKRSGQ